MIVTGIEHCKFVKDGKEVTFDRVTLLAEISPEKGEGQSAEIINVSPEKSAGLTIGEDVEVLYNKYGKVRRFEYVC